ncbi:MAG: helix-turn-helix transcriptional regulator [Clostridia bacterium]|nr:helix-turn-helix transcriptional regulator [Clostridia bacterium]MBR5633522.1 helix-turn-helix transcriptional regulator [Clostridia bacterium]
MELKQIIADNISALRRDMGMTQSELAEKLNYSDKAVSKWERGESVPDVTVLKSIAELFGVTVDYLLTEDHTPAEAPVPVIKKKQRLDNHTSITCISILIVWLLATFVFVMFDMITPHIFVHWLSFIYAIPVSMIVWLVFNSLWFNRRRNFLIISLLMWTLLISLYLSLLVFNIWQIFVLGIPGQAIILLWSRIKVE